MLPLSKQMYLHNCKFCSKKFLIQIYCLQSHDEEHKDTDLSASKTWMLIKRPALSEKYVIKNIYIKDEIAFSAACYTKAYIHFQKQKLKHMEKKKKRSHYSFSTIAVLQ